MAAASASHTPLVSGDPEEGCSQMIKMMEAVDEEMKTPSACPMQQ